MSEDQCVGRVQEVVQTLLDTEQRLPVKIPKGIRKAVYDCYKQQEVLPDWIKNPPEGTESRQSLYCYQIKPDKPIALSETGPSEKNARKFADLEKIVRTEDLEWYIWDEHPVVIQGTLNSSLDMQQSTKGTTHRLSGHSTDDFQFSMHVATRALVQITAKDFYREQYVGYCRYGPDDPVLGVRFFWNIDPSAVEPVDETAMQSVTLMGSEDN